MQKQKSEKHESVSKSAKDILKAIKKRFLEQTLLKKI